ncbi:MAG: DUF2690 domain-containing protein [Coleofasciculaceae cyanobacterium RL_1_1]|nr:DUF2690 domain-containing protein [Coleofasciculaceae cyanobacterium RL_1_1]
MIVVLKSTKGLSRAQELLLKDSPLQSGEFVKIVNAVLVTLLVMAGMLFALLAFNFHLTLRPPNTASVCFEKTCTGRDPKDAGCNIGVYTITSTVASFPEFGEEFKNIKLEMRHSDRCNASWVKAKAPIGSTLYLKGENGKIYVSTTIQDDGITDPHYTNMGPGNLTREACVRSPNGDVKCTEPIQ